MLKIEADFIHKDLRCVVALVPMRHRVAYVGIRRPHPFHGVADNDSIPKTPELATKALTNSVEDIGIMNAFCAGNPEDDNFLTPSLLLACHGGITYTGDGPYPVPSIGSLWWFGFDTAHYGDNPACGGQPFPYVLASTIKLADQLAALAESY